MGDFDPVSWATIEAATGPPAAEIVEHVDEMADDLGDESPYAAVRAVHDALYADDVERSVPNVAEPFVTAYLLERRGTLDPDEAAAEYHSLVERRPSDERLHELFWEQEYTIWWIGVLRGVPASLVTYWLWEADIPVMERNLTPETMAAVEAAREGGD